LNPSEPRTRKRRPAAQASQGVGDDGPHRLGRNNGCE
jgi:hypothetical protein